MSGSGLLIVLNGIETASVGILSGRPVPLLIVLNGIETPARLSLLIPACSSFNRTKWN